MRTYSAIRHFGSQAALARALGIRQQSIQDWGRTVPPLRQLQLERITEGKLKAAKDILHVPGGGGGVSADGLANVDLFDSGRDPFSPVLLAQQASVDGGTWSLTIPGAAVPKGRPRLGIINGHARAFTPQRTRTYEGVVRDAAAREWMRLPLAARPIWMRITFVRAIPQSWSAKKQNAALAGHLHPTGRPDLDNGVKLITDALNSIVYTDDALIVDISARKAYGAMPCVLVVVTW